jgi:voltage-gated potassium channel
MDEQRWQSRTEAPLVVASLVYLAAYSWRVIANLEGTARLVADIVIAITWAMFIADYLIRLAMASQKWRWFRTHLGSLTFALIPVLRLVYLLRFLTRLPGVRTSAGGRLRTRILVYGIGASVVLIIVCSLAVLEAERGAPGATITSFGDAVWWACVTVTTTGFGDYTPVTVRGRAVGVGLMFGGVALAGIITATLASWVFERASGAQDDAPATSAQVQELMAKLDDLTGRGPSTGPDSANRSEERPGG